MLKKLEPLRLKQNYLVLIKKECTQIIAYADVGRAIPSFKNAQNQPASYLYKISVLFFRSNCYKRFLEQMQIFQETCLDVKRTHINIQETMFFSDIIFL